MQSCAAAGRPVLGTLVREALTTWGHQTGLSVTLTPPSCENKGKSTEFDANNTNCCSNNGVVLTKGGYLLHGPRNGTPGGHFSR